MATQSSAQKSLQREKALNLHITITRPSTTQFLLSIRGYLKGIYKRLNQPNSLWPHRLALLTAVATFSLLFVGGLVTSTGSGLAVPDWPTTFGYNMFLYPWSKMVGGIFYEHSHRLIGSAVGLLTVLLAFTLWYKESRQWLRWLGVVALGAVIAQGVLGGLRVVLLQQTLAILHGCLAHAFFALTVSLALLTSAEWREQPVKKIATDTGQVQRLGLLTTGFLYLQVILGAILRHRGEWADLHLAGAVLAAIYVLRLAARVRRNYANLPALVLGSVFLWYGVSLALSCSQAAARRLLFASLVYLPVLLAVMAFDKVLF